MAEIEVSGTGRLATPRREVEVALIGCDDTTYVYLRVTPAELAFLRRLETASKAASEYGCMPTLAVEEDVAEFDWQYHEQENADE